MANSSSHDLQPERPMNIGRAAVASGVSAKMIRHYESLGLIGKTARTPSNYRVYGMNDVHTLQFIRRARSLGFSMKEIAELVSLWRNRRRSSEQVRKIAVKHLAELQQKIIELQSMAQTLEQLASSCHGNSRPECPILDELASEPRS